MAKGDIKAGRGMLIGAAGEYFVMGELLRRGWLAGMTPRGATDFDIIASRGDRVVSVRVKSKTADATIFRWNRKVEGCVLRSPIAANDFSVLVDLRTAGEPPEYRREHATSELETKLQSNFGRMASRKAQPIRRE